MDWAVGAIWVPGEGRGPPLSLAVDTHPAWTVRRSSNRLTRELSLGRGMGLPGVALGTQRPVTAAMPAEEAAAARTRPRRDAGLKAGRAIPVDVAARKQLWSIELFGTGRQPADGAFCRPSPRRAAKSVSSWCENAPRQSPPTAPSTIR